MDEKRIGEIVKKRREDKNISKEYIEETLNIKPETLERIENGEIKYRRNYAPFYLKRLFEALDIPTQILNGHFSKNKPLLKTDSLIQQQKIINLIESVNDIEKLKYIEKAVSSELSKSPDDPIIVATFAERLTELLLEKNIDYVDLANATSIDKGHIAKYLNGSSRPSVQNLYRIARELSVSPKWLYGYNVGVNYSFAAYYEEIYFILYCSTSLKDSDYILNFLYCNILGLQKENKTILNYREENILIKNILNSIDYATRYEEVLAGVFDLIENKEKWLKTESDHGSINPKEIRLFIVNKILKSLYDKKDSLEFISKNIIYRLFDFKYRDKFDKLLKDTNDSILKRNETAKRLYQNDIVN